MTYRAIFILSLGLLSSLASAAGVGEDPFNVYYTVRERPAGVATFQSPTEVMGSVQKVAKWAMNLLDLEFHNQELPPPAEPYNRLKHFGGWIHDRRDGQCYDTRARVLIRDSARPVAFGSNRCVVASGEWREPYAGLTRTVANQVQIDHVVALKNAYQSGASRWNWPQRCLYANYLGNADHLLAVDGRENMVKGDRSPADWMPSNRAGHCGHLRRWLQEKLLFGLALSDREARAIATLAKNEGCPANTFVYAWDDFSAQRQQIQANVGLCKNAPPGSGDLTP